VPFIAGDNGGSGEGGLEGRDVLKGDGTAASIAERLRQAD